MNEKQELLKLIRTMKSNFQKNNINDYYNIIFLTKMLLENNEADSEILNEFLMLLYTAIKIHSSNCCEQQPEEKDQQSIKEEKFIRQNNMDQEFLKFMDKQYKNFSQPIQELLSYRIFLPESINPSYHARME